MCHPLNALLGVTLLMLASFGFSSTKETASSPESDSATKAKTVWVDINTSAGTMTLKLDPVQAPVTVANFLRYADEGFYNGTVFHRVIANFMIQGGGMTADLHQKETHMPVKNESGNGLGNRRGTIAMARTNDPNSATSQFFINLADNDHLDGSRSQPGYTVFGKVVDGMAVVDAIGNTRTTRKGSFSDVPTQPITINNITLRNPTP